jgi:DNA polymerase-1
MDYLAKMKFDGISGGTIDFDIELMNEEVSCISLSSDYHNVMSIPFIDSKGNFFSPQQEADIWRLIASILENPKIRKRGQYIIFDTHLLLRKYGIASCNLDDTMVAQKTLMPDYPVGLDFITSIHTDKEYYKDEGKKYFSGGNWPRLWQYNATDSSICGEAFPKQFAELQRQGNVETYERQRKMIEPLAYMMERGIRINLASMTKAYNEAEIEIEKLKMELNNMVGFDLNSNSPKQLIDYFYIGKKIPPYKTKGKITTDETAMVRIARKGFPEAYKILDIRRAVKNRSTYLNPEKIDSDSRLRCAYNPVGTRYSRISSSKNIFGTGNNLQNQPHDVLKFFLADEGYIYYGMDLSQAENRIVAYVGQIPQMIEAFEKELDVHSLTGALISGLSPDEVKRQDKENIPCQLGDKKKTWRFYGKKSNHGLNYDLGYKNFALDLEISESDSKFIVTRYHLAYPGVRNNYHAMVKKQLGINRTITNLMGRKTLFLDEWEDALFKEAYACIPQGTVGDVINERGVEYLYYNQDLFAPVELLTQVHDSVGFQIPISIGWSEHARMLTLLKSSLETPLKLPNGNTFVIPVDTSLGFSMYDKECKKISSKAFPTSLTALADKLKLTYEILVREKDERSNS